jgi:hypothetical protein
MATVKTACKDLQVLKEVLKDMGFETVEGKSSVKAMDGKTTEVVAKIKGQEFGIEQTKDANGDLVYNVTGEFYRTKWYGQEKAMTDKINRGYAARKTKHELEALGYVVAENQELKENADGTIEITMTKY